jgi:hypothetical protein
MGPSGHCSIRGNEEADLKERDQVLLLWCRSLVFRWHLRVSSGGSGSGNLNHTAPLGAWNCLSSVESVAEKAKKNSV